MENFIFWVVYGRVKYRTNSSNKVQYFDGSYIWIYTGLNIENTFI